MTVNGVVDGLSEDDLNDNLTVSGKTLTVTPEVVGENFSVDAGYKVVFSEGDYGNSTFTGTAGKDTIEVNGSGLQISLGAGNDTVTSNGDGGNTYMFDANGGKDVVKGYNSDDVIKITDSSSVTTSVKGSDIIVKAGSATMTLKNAATGTRLNVVDANGNAIVDEKVYSDRIVVDDGATLLSAFNATNFTAEDPIVKVDASVVTKRFSLTGGDGDNTLIGGKGTNVINGNAGDDILIGNGGADTFVYSSGDDTIIDYGNGSDKISLTSAFQSFDLSGDNVIIAFDDGSLTISDAANSSISFVETTNGRVTTNVNIFAENGIFNKLKTAVTLKADASSYTAPTNVISIDGGLATGDVEIIGNSKANKIYAGNNGSTIDGGASNDSLWGGNGSDTFIYSGGNDVVYGFGEGDALQLGGDFTASVKNGAISFKVGSTANAVTLKDYSATTFNVNGETYAISNGSNFVKK